MQFTKSQSSGKKYNVQHWTVVQRMEFCGLKFQYLVFMRHEKKINIQ